MEMWRKDKNYSFCMKYAVISWAVPLESQAGIKAWDWREPQNHAAQPMHSDHNPQGPAEEWLCSTHCSAMRDEYTPCEEQTHWCGDFIKAPAAWRSSLRNLNLSGDFSCFQSSACFFHLGYWLKGAEKCSTDNKWSVLKNIIAVWNLQVFGGFRQVHHWTFSAEKWGWTEDNKMIFFPAGLTLQPVSLPP